jgi:hypothetical protein
VFAGGLDPRLLAEILAPSARNSPEVLWRVSVRPDKSAAHAINASKSDTSRNDFELAGARLDLRPSGFNTQALHRLSRRYTYIEAEGTGKLAHAQGGSCSQLLHAQGLG